MYHVACRQALGFCGAVTISSFEFLSLQLLPQFSRYWVQTFVSHPWVFRDADSGDGLVGNQKAVFWPHDNEFSENYFQVNIGIPGKNICTQYCIENLEPRIKL